MAYTLLVVLHSLQLKEREIWVIYSMNVFISKNFPPLVRHPLNQTWLGVKHLIVFEAASHSVAQIGLEPMTVQVHQPPKWHLGLKFLAKSKCGNFMLVLGEMVEIFTVLWNHRIYEPCYNFKPTSSTKILRQTILLLWFLAGKWPFSTQGLCTFRRFQPVYANNFVCHNSGEDATVI